MTAEEMAPTQRMFAERDEVRCDKLKLWIDVNRLDVMHLQI